MKLLLFITIELQASKLKPSEGFLTLIFEVQLHQLRGARAYANAQGKLALHPLQLICQ